MKGEGRRVNGGGGRMEVLDGCMWGKNILCIIKVFNISERGRCRWVGVGVPKLYISSNWFKIKLHAAHSKVVFLYILGPY